MQDLWFEQKGESLRQAVIRRKKELKAAFDYKKAYDTVRKRLEPKIEKVLAHPDRAIGEVFYEDIEKKQTKESVKKHLQDSGTCIVRGVFEKETVEQWNQEITQYLERNDYIGKSVEKAGMDQYFSGLSSSKPQIYCVYWSKPQIEARQSPRMVATKYFLNAFWQDPLDEISIEEDYVYADRVRKRAPGDDSLGLSPHVDGGSVERWLDDGFYRVYEKIFTGNIDKYSPFDVSYRTKTQEVSSPAVCRMFRTYQGWMALTPQGIRDGTLQLIPLVDAMSFILLRALQDDVPEDDLCGAEPGRALNIIPEYHQFILDALVSIPKVESGDTVWWHSDCVHAVEDRHDGNNYSNVIYIGSTPGCPKNKKFLEIQKKAFLLGESSPDFAPEHYETDFSGRAKLDDLTELGKRQMGFD